MTNTYNQRKEEAQTYREALIDILECSSLFIAKEIAADAIGVDLDDYLADLEEPERDLDMGTDEDDSYGSGIKDLLSEFE